MFPYAASPVLDRRPSPLARPLHSSSAVPSTPPSLASALPISPPLPLYPLVRYRPPTSIPSLLSPHARSFPVNAVPSPADLPPAWPTVRSLSPPPPLAPLSFPPPNIPPPPYARWTLPLQSYLSPLFSAPASLYSPYAPMPPTPAAPQTRSWQSRYAD